MGLYHHLKSISEAEASQAFRDLVNRLDEDEGFALADTFNDNEGFSVLTAIARSIEEVKIASGYSPAEANREAKGALMGFAVLKEIAENRLIK